MSGHVIPAQTLWLASVYFCYLLYCIYYITITHRTSVTYLVLAGFTHVSGVSWLSPSSELLGSVLHSSSPSCLLAGACCHFRGGLQGEWSGHEHVIKFVVLLATGGHMTRSRVIVGERPYQRAQKQGSMDNNNNQNDKAIYLPQLLLLRIRTSNF